MSAKTRQPRLQALLALPFLIFSLLLNQGCDNNQYEPIGDIDPDVPFAVTDLTIEVSNDTIQLTWTASGDDGPVGTASRYDLRRHTRFITTANWSDATPVSGVARPLITGSPESFTLLGIAPTATVYLALKVVDDSGNNSKLSNIVFVDRQPPAVTNDLAALRVRDQSVTLTWTAPEDDSPLGQAVRYEMRASEAVLTAANWDDTPPRFGPANPAAPGQSEIFALRGLTPLTHYYVAIRSRDDAGNLSDLSNLLELDTAQTPLGWWDGFAGQGVVGNVRSFSSMDDTLYVGGDFTQVGAMVTRSIAAWDGAGWSTLGRGLAGGTFGTIVLDLEPYNGMLHVTGSFRIAGGTLVSNLARWSGTGWENLGDGPTAFPASALGTFDGDLFIGGFFNQGADSPFTFLARYDGVSFHSMNWNPDANSNVTRILPFGNNLVVAGGFSEVPGSSAASVAIWDGFSYSVPEPDLVGRFDTPFITALCEFEGDLIVGGDFTSVGGATLNHIARWDGTSWHSLAGGMSGVEFPAVIALTVYRGFLVAGGTFAMAGSESASNIAIWDGINWTSLGAGVAGADPQASGVRALVSHAGSLYVGGAFDTADGQPSPNIARWDLD